MRRACGGGGYACLADMIKEVAAVEGVADHEACFQRRLKAGDVERLVAGELVIPFFDEGGEKVVSECGY